MYTKIYRVHCICVRQTQACSLPPKKEDFRKKKKIVLLLLSASVERFSVSNMQFFLNNNVVYSDRSEVLKKKLAFFSKHQLQAFSNRTDTHKENVVVLLCKRLHSSTRGLGNGLGRVHSRYSG
jgi:hypothetical protein